VTFTAVVTGTSGAPSGTVRLVEGSVLGVDCAIDRLLTSKSVEASGPSTSQAVFKRSFTAGTHFLRACFQDAAAAFGASQSDIIAQVVQIRK